MFFERKNSKKNRLARLRAQRDKLLKKLIKKESEERLKSEISSIKKKLSK